MNGLLQRNDAYIWIVGSSTCRSRKGISPDALRSRGSGTVQDQHQQGSTFTVNITTGKLWWRVALLCNTKFYSFLEPSSGKVLGGDQHPRQLPCESMSNWNGRAWWNRHGIFNAKVLCVLVCHPCLLCGHQISNSSLEWTHHSRYIYWPFAPL